MAQSVTQTWAASSSSSAALAANPSGASAASCLVCIAVVSTLSFPASVKDQLNNSFTQDAQLEASVQMNGTNAFVSFWHLDAAASVTAVTVNSAAAQKLAVRGWEVAGSPAGGRDLNVTADINVSTTTPGIGPSAATAQANEIVFGVLGVCNNPALSAESLNGSTAGVVADGAVSPNFDCVLDTGYVIVNAAAAMTYSLTSAGNINAAMLLVSFKATGFATVLPDADLASTGWSTAPLFSKVNDASDATLITATLA